MVKSMTGYGLGENELFRVEMRSHNHRFCETLLHLPPQFAPLEHKVRDHIKGRISRGRIQAVINHEAEETCGFEIDEDAAKNFVSSLRKAGESLGLQDDLSLGHLIFAPKDITLLRKKDYDLENLWGHLKEALDRAIDNLLVMRREEGKRLCEDILGRVKAIRSLLEGIKGRANEVVAEYKERLSKRVSELLEGKVDENRLNVEMAVFAEKSDITEELVRLTSHLEQVQETLEMDSPIGKRLDFLNQEVNREINTVASKTTSVKIIQDVVEIKSELEKIREQVQNVE